MERARALEVLGLDETASRDEIESAWRSAIKNVHPDSGKESDADAVSEILDARKVALSEGNASSTGLVPLARVTDLIKLQQGEIAAKARASEQAMRGVVMHHIGTLAFRRRQRTILAGISAGVATVLGLLTALIRVSPDADIEVQSLLGTMTGAFALIAAGLGLLAWRIATLERSLQMELDDVAETLSDKAAFSDTINEVGLGSFFTKSQLQEAIREWSANGMPSGARSPSSGLFGGMYRSVPLASTAHAIGPVDFGKLFLAKGIELGLLEEVERETSDGSVDYGFSRAGRASTQ